MFHQNRPFLQIFFFGWLVTSWIFFFAYSCRFRCRTVRPSPLQLPKQPFLPSSFLKVYKWTFVVVLGPCSLVAWWLLCIAQMAIKTQFLGDKSAKTQTFAIKFVDGDSKKRNIRRQKNVILKQCNNSGYATKVARSS